MPRMSPTRGRQVPTTCQALPPTPLVAASMASWACQMETSPLLLLLLLLLGYSIDVSWHPSSGAPRHRPRLRLAKSPAPSGERIRRHAPDRQSFGPVVVALSYRAMRRMPPLPLRADSVPASWAACGANIAWHRTETSADISAHHTEPSMKKSAD